ncbi:PucR-like helix-turn-helix protein [Prauserella shujinwangii]|uniref:PucR-like helix-turn-helix protein n=1 Tax=Prauserella shujinwangii TaxID=1453103 RepID=A0A2T0LKH9_9PSEU|nr:helix-turn-helix domain-containing protein [Prauserella shujinwangii]PRX43412.1 PucR-like helix-turn-helix protein [Prauserella shujinwangii]
MEVTDSRLKTDVLRRMHADAAREDGLRRLVRRVAREVNGRAAVLDGGGSPVYAHPRLPADVLPAAAADIERIRTGRVRSATVRHGGSTVSAMSISDGPGGPVLLVMAGADDLAAASGVVADAARLLALRWAVDAARRDRARVDRADVAVREAVLHLLMLGERDAANRVAAALGPRLPATLRVFVAESAAAARERLATGIAELTAGTAWIVRCPVYPGHVIALVPEPAADRAGEALRELADGGGSRIGASGPVVLRNVRYGYEQAFHALAHARGGPARYAEFSPADDLATVLGPAAHAWAAAQLAPLRQHVPARPKEPTAAELEVTLDSWLSFHRRAAAQLKIHRNTLSSRLGRVARILGRDVHDLATQAALHLALRLSADATGEERAGRAELDALLGTPAAAEWSARQLAPLVEDGPRTLGTVRTWLAHNTRLDAAAAELGVSVPAVRKRLVRAETLLRRSLLHGPSVRYDLYFALRVRDGAPDPGPPGQ